MLQDGTHLAESSEEKEAVYRFRYDVYVDEMGRYRGVADHDRRRFYEPEDETARIFYAAIDGKVVATSRFNWGGDAPFTARLIDHYRLEPRFPRNKSPSASEGWCDLTSEEAESSGSSERSLKPLLARSACS